MQALSVGTGFKIANEKSGFVIWACAILPTHTHLVIKRHHFEIKQVANLLKGEATKQLTCDERHPLSQFAKPESRPPSPWGVKQRDIYLYTDSDIRTRIKYVEDNPANDGKPRQHWSFVTEYTGLESNS